MQVPLICHPQSDAGGAEGIQVVISRSDSGKVELTYGVLGSLEAVEIVAPAAPERVDELWKKTCFELFVGNIEDEIYLEYNFAPSGQWAAYQFSGYRADMAELETEVPDIQTEENESVLNVSVKFQLPDAWRGRALLAGVSAVIATKSGDFSYWAVAHPPGKPDFHHRDCFALHLEARGTL